MAELNPPWALQNLGTHTANVNRMGLLALAGAAEGILLNYSGGSQLSVSQRGAGANMSVDVSMGVVAVMGDENNMQGLYLCVNDATKNVTIAAADGTNPRRDLVVARVRDSFYSGGTNAWDLFVVTGTPAASPADPAMPNNAVCLARVAVAAGASSVVNANITDLRPFTPLGNLVGNSARRPGVLYGPYSQEPGFKPVPVTGQMFYEQDTNLLYVYNGSAWVCITPQSATVLTQQNSASTTYVDLPTAGPSVTIQTGTKALVTYSTFHLNTATTNADFCSVAVSGATTLAAADSPYGQGIQATSTTGGVQMSRTVLLTGLTAGLNTFKLQYRTNGGTGTWGNRDLTVVGIP